MSDTMIQWCDHPQFNELTLLQESLLKTYTLNLIVLNMPLIYHY